MWNGGGGWSDGDEDGLVGTGPTISSPSATTHVSKVRCMGALSRPGRFSFSARMTYICSLVGDKFHYARRKSQAGGMQQQLQHQHGSMKGCKTISLSKLRRIYFHYDHTVTEHSLQRNRITFEYAVASSTSLTNSTSSPSLETSEAAAMTKRSAIAKQQNGITDLTFSAASDKDMFRWEACLRSVPSVHTRCRSVLKDHLGRLRPYQHGMGQFARVEGMSQLRCESTGTLSSIATSASSTDKTESVDEREEHEVSAAAVFETVNSISVQLPDELGEMRISLSASSLQVTIGDLKMIVFENIRKMQKRLQEESGLDKTVRESKGAPSSSMGAEPSAIDISAYPPSSATATVASSPSLSAPKSSATPHRKADWSQSPNPTEKHAPVLLTKQQFINPLAFATKTHFQTPHSSTFRSPRAGSTLSDANHLPNQVLNPFAALQNQKEEAASLAVRQPLDSDLSPLMTPSQALAQHELTNVEDILRRGANAFLLYRPYRKLDADIGAEMWAFEEQKSVESLSIGGSGLLNLELRAASDMPQSGLRCHVRKTKAKDIFGKVTDHYHLRILAADLSWNTKYKFAAIKKFAISLRSAYLELPLEQRRLISSRRFADRQPEGPKKNAVADETPLPLPAPGKLSDNVESVQLYMDSVLAHPWASSGHHLLEFLGAATAARDRTERMVVHISQLREYVSPGDIVLFKCSDRWSGLTRLMLRDRFDHVGVIVQGKNPGSSLRILESTGEGVKTYPLVGRLRGYFLADFVHFISVRRIIAPREEKALIRCAQFVSTVEGKPYRLRQAVVGRIRGRHVKHNLSNGNDSMKDFASGQGVSNKAEKSPRETKRTRRKSMDGSQSGYFCSEITAAYLKHLGFIGDRDADCAAYWPGDFDEGGSVEQDILRMGFHMEKIVDLDLRIVELAKAERRAGVIRRCETEGSEGIGLKL